MALFRKNKVQPIPPPKHLREIKISRNPWKKSVKIVILAIIILILGAGLWIGFSANSALKKITGGNNSSSIFSFLGDLDTSNIKGKAQGRTNILLLGMGGKNHPGGMLSDTMITASINYEEKRIGLISIPRDLWAPIPGFNHAKINEAYSNGENNKNSTGGGGALSSRTVENVLGLPMHYYISLDFEGFKKIVDTVGGIDIYVEEEINDPSYPAADMIHYEPFRISAGMHHMDGNLALKYARSRKTTSDFDRSRRQMQVMAAVREKILTLGILGNPKKITDLLNILGDHIRTNMSVSEIRALWDEGKSLDTTKIVNKVLDTGTNGLLISGQDSRGYYVYPKKGIDNFSAIASLAKNLFQEGAAETTPAQIEVSNAAGRKGAASAVSQYLESYGFSIKKIDTASQTIAKTVVTDFSGGKFAKIAEDLAAKLKAELKTLDQVGSSFDIQVLVGQDYLNNL